MAERTATIDIDGTPDAVWTVAGDFGGIADWNEGIDSCRVDGDTRVIEAMGMTITEALVSKDDAARSISYSVVDGVPVESHKATITVSAAGDGSHVTYVVDAEPESMADLMQGVYQATLEALKSHVEG